MADPLIQDAQSKMRAAADHLVQVYARLNVGRASTALVEDLTVLVYGASTPVKGLGNVSTPDASTVVIAPWDRALLSEIEKAIVNAGIGLTPQNDGVVIRLNVPRPTEEKRKELTKLVHEEAEQARITVRTLRQDVLSKLKTQAKNDEITEDDQHMLEKQLQQAVDEVNKLIGDSADKKEEDLLKI